MHLTISKKQRFYPEFHNNLSLPEPERCLVRFNTPTTTSKIKVSAPSQAFAKADSKGRIGDLEIRLGEDDDFLIMEEHKVSIENCSYEDELGNKINIVNARNLFDAPTDFTPLIKEIIKKIKESFKEVISEKNSE